MRQHTTRSDKDDDRIRMATRISFAAAKKRRVAVSMAVALGLVVLMPRLVVGLSLRTRCTHGSCKVQLPGLCGSSAELAPEHAAALERLCTPVAGCPTGTGETCDFPYKYGYNAINTSCGTFWGYYDDAENATPKGFARALLEASFDSEQVEGRSRSTVGSGRSFAALEPALQIRAARRFAAQAFVLKKNATLTIDPLDDLLLGADQVLSLLLNRTVSGAQGYCGFCANWLTKLLNDAVLPQGTETPAFTLNLANNFPGSGGLTHVANTVPTPGPEGNLIYATQDAYFNYEFVRCSDRSTPLDLREMLRAIASRNVSEICVPPADDRLHFPRLAIAIDTIDHSARNASVVLNQTETVPTDGPTGGDRTWPRVADKSTVFGSWVNQTLELFGCPTEDDEVGNLYYYMLVASWGPGKIDPEFIADVSSIVCSEQNPCKKAPEYLPLCTGEYKPSIGEYKPSIFQEIEQFRVAEARARCAISGE